MAIFISYAHADAEFVDTLAMNLVQRHVHVWMDKWELRVGDSILNRIQEAIKQSGALLIILSRASVASTWCNKELNAGLVRELGENRVLVLPVLIEDCDIPLFLQDKKYADFRTSFDSGLNDLVDSLAKVTSIDQGRIESKNYHTDWSETWAYDGDAFVVEYTLIQTSPELEYTLLTQITVHCNELATRQYREFAKYHLGWMGRVKITEHLAGLAQAEQIRLLLTDQRPQFARYILHDPRSDLAYRINIRCQRLGLDIGGDQLVDVTAFLMQMRDSQRRASRQPTAEEIRRLGDLLRESEG